MPAAPDKKTFQELQYDFTRHMRDPDNQPAPADIEDRRMKIYRDLLYNNIEGFMANSFPVLRKITPDNTWHEMIRDYFKNHQSRTPFFPKMPQEFLTYLQNERNIENDPPFIRELAHYEWIEVELTYDDRNVNLDNIDPNGDLLSGIPVLNPLSHLLQYHFPVHRISPEYLPEAESDQLTFLLVYRDLADKVGFIELNPVSARLLSLLKSDDQLSGSQLLEMIAQELNHPNPEQVVNGGLEIMQSMLKKNVLLGSREI